MINIKIGVLALQGAFHEHNDIFNKLDSVESFLVRTEKELEMADALVLPGGWKYNHGFDCKAVWTTTLFEKVCWRR